MLNVENIEKDGKILAIILRSAEPDKPVEFVTPKDFPLQLGVHKRRKGDYVKAHDHVPFENLSNIPVQEFIFVKKGKISVGLYHNKEIYKEIIVSSGESILINTGHNVKFLEDTDMMEVKQGPYREKQNEKISLE
tara:strand:+ start:255 stop:659 length:405 start_codon:yes stop_codon:yes gene_type:complete